MRKVDVTLVSLCAAIALAACNQDGSREAQAGQDSPRASGALPAPPAGEATGGTKSSIIRPEVEAEQNAAPREPLNAVVSFADNGAGLNDAAKAELDRIIKSPQARAGGAITLRGHTDSVGDDAVNLRISERRAETVRDYLVTNGIAAERITVIALGEMRPAAPNAMLDGSPDEAGRAKNRRVDVEIALPDAAELEQDRAAAALPDAGPDARPEYRNPAHSAVTARSAKSTERAG